jgi:hypothetical protein
MAYSCVSVSTPNEFITALSIFAKAVGWTVKYEGDDLPIDGTATTDGKRLVLSSPAGSTFAHFRAANGKRIFPTHTTNGYMYGVGLTCSTAYTESPASGFWYDQTGAIANSSSEVIGVGIPLLNGTAMDVYFNHISDPAEMIIASVEIYTGFFVHIAVGEAYKIGSWTGGTICSASYNSALMLPATLSQSVLDSTSNQIFATNTNANTFLRANIDAAPNRTPEVLWAGSGILTTAVSGYTGKKMALPVVGKSALSSCPKIPHYGYLQSQSANDPGRNVNTLNCISVNLPLAIYVLRDPDALANYSQCGYVPGIYFISTKNVAAKSIYSVDYPSSGINYQAFPHSIRGGSLGYDGFSVKQ